jgi:3-oxoacyl-[acyl-carrier protein] reductase
VTNAGLDDFMPLQQTAEQHYHSHYDVNALGVNLVVKETVKYINKKHGCILNISSLSSTHRHESDLV